LSEKQLNDLLVGNSTFLVNLVNLAKSKGIPGLSARALKQLQSIDTGEESARNLDRKREISPNGRKSNFDLYYASGPLKIVFELKTGKVGFRGIAQAAYYNCCLGLENHMVLLIGPGKGPDYSNFGKYCLKPESLVNVGFVSFEDLGISKLDDGSYDIKIYPSSRFVISPVTSKS